MDDIKNEFIKFEQYVYDNVKSQLTHNHVPVTELVEDCNYCKLFGNVFHNGPINSKQNMMYTKHIVYTCET